jgi:uncharacterized damage-inducible protein DinB
MNAPQNPAGEFVAEESPSRQRRDELISAIEAAPSFLSAAVKGLSKDQLDTKYRNWSIRQIVHHLVDSHLNSYIRFKWALTEEHPTIKAYDEGKWADLEDSRTGDVLVPIGLLHALHARWVMLLRSMTDAQFDRTFFHPESKKSTSLNAALPYYAWHSRHHTAQINWVREQANWK